MYMCVHVEYVRTAGFAEDTPGAGAFISTASVAYIILLVRFLRTVFVSAVARFDVLSHVHVLVAVLWASKSVCTSSFLCTSSVFYEY